LDKYRRNHLTGKLVIFAKNPNLCYSQYENKILICVGENDIYYFYYMPDGNIMGWTKTNLDNWEERKKTNQFYIEPLEK